MSNETDSNFAVVLKGSVIIALSGAIPGSNEINIELQGGRKLRLFHSQDCCESVNIQSVTGEVENVIGSTIIEAIENIFGNNEYPPDQPKLEYEDSFTWTDFILKTHKGAFRVRWLGSSNGCYSESVSFVEIRA